MRNKILLCGSLTVLLSCIILINMDYEPINSAYAINYDQKSGMPISLSGDEFIIVRDSALSDPTVKALIDGRNYIISDCCGFVQIGGPSAQWQPVINLSVANELQIAVRVDLDSHKVVDIQTAPFIQLKIPVSEGMTKAEQVVAQSSSEHGAAGIPMLAVSNSTVLPLIGVLGIIFGGAAAGVFYYVTKRNRLAARGANSK